MFRLFPLLLVLGIGLFLCFGVMELAVSMRQLFDQAHMQRKALPPCQEGCSSLSLDWIPKGFSSRLTLPRMATTPAHSALLSTNSARSISA